MESRAQEVKSETVEKSDERALVWLQGNIITVLAAYSRLRGIKGIFRNIVSKRQSHIERLGELAKIGGKEPRVCLKFKKPLSGNFKKDIFEEIVTVLEEILKDKSSAMNDLIGLLNEHPNDYHFLRMIFFLLQEIQFDALSEKTFFPSMRDAFVYCDSRYGLSYWRACELPADEFSVAKFNYLMEKIIKLFYFDNEVSRGLKEIYHSYNIVIPNEECWEFSKKPEAKYFLWAHQSIHSLISSYPNDDRVRLLKSTAENFTREEKNETIFREYHNQLEVIWNAAAEQEGKFENLVKKINSPQADAKYDLLRKIGLMLQAMGSFPYQTRQFEKYKAFLTAAFNAEMVRHKGFNAFIHEINAIKKRDFWRDMAFLLQEMEWLPQSRWSRRVVPPECFTAQSVTRLRQTSHPLNQKLPDAPQARQLRR